MVLALICGHHKGERSLRQRVLIGVFFGNAVCSAVNTVPVGLQKDGRNDCGKPVCPGSVASVRAL